MFCNVRGQQTVLSNPGLEGSSLSSAPLSRKGLKLLLAVREQYSATISLLHTLPPPSFTLLSAATCSLSSQLYFTKARQTSQEYQTPSKQQKCTAEVTNWNSQCEQFQSFTCCFQLFGSEAYCGGRQQLADVSMCRDAAEVFSKVLRSGHALIVW